MRERVRENLNKVMVANFLRVQVMLTERANELAKKRGLDGAPSIEIPMHHPRDPVRNQHSNPGV